MKYCSYRSKMHKSKRGGAAVEEVTGAVIVLIAAVLLVFIFYILNIFNFLSREDSIKADIEDVNAVYDLNYFLRMQAEGGNVADLINEAHSTNNYDTFKRVYTNFFDGIYKDKGLLYSMKIGTVTINMVNFAGISGYSKAQIPLHNKESGDIELFVGRGNAREIE